MKVMYRGKELDVLISYESFGGGVNNVCVARTADGRYFGTTILHGKETAIANLKKNIRAAERRAEECKGGELW